MPKNENTYNPWDRLLVAVIMVRKNKNYSCVFVCPRKSIIGAGGMVKSNGCFSRGPRLSCCPQLHSALHVGCWFDP
jgi:hypothetical protein